MFPFLYFFQLLNNWPRMLVISWNSMLNTSTSVAPIKFKFLSDNIPEMWNDSNDVMKREAIVRLEVCDDIDSTSSHLSYQWKMYQLGVNTTIFNNNCYVDIPIDSQDVIHVSVTVFEQNNTIYESKLLIPKPSIYWIAAIGDSFSSGQGNPDVPLSSKQPARWLNESCYRSSKGFPHKLLKHSSNHSALTFLSCSGATVENGILSKNGQLETLEKMIKIRAVSPDVLILTIGGNDIGFTDIISTIQQGSGVDGSIDMRFFYVSHQLDRVAARIKTLKISNVILVNYYDVTRNEYGRVDASCKLFGQISSEKLQLAENKILQRLNKILMKKAEKYGWTTVDTADIFQTRGSCSKYSLIRSRNESLILQGNEYGSFHPNEEAHELISQKISRILKF